ncbi:MAG: 3-deoxy-7-phosphoheptulonate synthase [Ignavibacterium sp.]|nr:3-deoxy-7-phosphoheptulonate synthase [Ignavibacterium sp.]MDW8375687.1 3-deoxy-7-phosphoheptulonate synthase [Ignavibacteriales bacterium]
MILILDKNISTEKFDIIIEEINKAGANYSKSNNEDFITLELIGIRSDFDVRKFKVLDGVIDAIRISEPYKLASRRYKSQKTIIEINDVKIGSDEIIVIAGPCSVESEEQIHSLAKKVKATGAKILRGGAFKPRTSPYSFQGLGEDGLRFLRQAADENNLLTVTEIIDSAQFDLIEKYTDIFQVGSRNMYNYPLLKVLSKTSKPVLLKRGMSATIDEWLMSAEYLLSGGNTNVILCERGIRTFENNSRFTFDISAINTIQEKSHLPVCSDPSHATGFRDKVIPMARAAVAANTDLLMIEVHDDPSNALSDGPQAITSNQFEFLMNQLKQIAQVIGRRIG